MSEAFVLPADVFDRLNHMAEAFGGVGAGTFVDAEDVVEESYYSTYAPLCIVGMKSFDHDINELFDGARVLFDTMYNDQAVARINKRKGRRLYNRVSWKEYCEERNIHREDA